MTISILHGDCREILRTLPDQSVQCCVTSPPYYGLRDYGMAGQMGLEPTPDAFVTEIVAVFREVRRVLRDDGTFWLNLGDTYAGSRGGGAPSGSSTLTGNGHIGGGPKLASLTPSRRRDGAPVPRSDVRIDGLKPKDLIGIPWRVAFALQADGWYLRQDIIWHKPNPMPESVRDRCAKAHEYIFLFSKSGRYFFDAEAIAEESMCPEGPENMEDSRYVVASRSDEKMRTKAGLAQIGPRERRNRRSVWTVPTRGFSGAHFATFPPDLIRPCILAGSRAGDVVLDPFNGAGTTGLVALEYGRRYVGVEINADYVRMTLERLRGVPLPLGIEVGA